MAAGIVQSNGGAIYECGNYGNLEVKNSSSSQVGGISYSNYTDAIIEKCFNKGNLIAKSERTYVGGIVANCDGTIKDCYNTGNIIASGSYSPRVGCIAGVTENCTIKNCYNTGNLDVVEVSKYTKAGGIVGECTRGINTIERCYSTGKITGVGTGYNYVGGIIGQGITDNNINNCYYLEGKAESINGNLTLENETDYVVSPTKIITNEFLELINGESKFKIDSNNINNGYPILKWQED